MAKYDIGDVVKVKRRFTRSRPEEEFLGMVIKLDGCWIHTTMTERYWEDNYTVYSFYDHMLCEDNHDCHLQDLGINLIKNFEEVFDTLH